MQQQLFVQLTLHCIVLNKVAAYLRHLVNSWCQTNCYEVQYLLKTGKGHHLVLSQHNITSPDQRAISKKCIYFWILPANWKTHHSGVFNDCKFTCHATLSKWLESLWLIAKESESCTAQKMPYGIPSLPCWPSWPSVHTLSQGLLFALGMWSWWLRHPWSFSQLNLRNGMKLWTLKGLWFNYNWSVVF